MQTGTWLIPPQYSLWSDRFWNSEYGHAYPPQEGLINREEKSLRHIAMVAKFSDDSKPKIHFKSKFALFQTSFIWSYSFAFNLSNVGETIWIESERTVSEGFLFPRTKQIVGIIWYPYKAHLIQRKWKGFLSPGTKQTVRNSEVSLLSGYCPKAGFDCIITCMVTGLKSEDPVGRAAFKTAIWKTYWRHRVTGTEEQVGQKKRL